MSPSDVDGNTKEANKVIGCTVVFSAAKQRHERVIQKRYEVHANQKYNMCNLNTPQCLHNALTEIRLKKSFDRVQNDSTNDWYSVKRAISNY